MRALPLLALVLSLSASSVRATTSRPHADPPVAQTPAPGGGAKRQGVGLPGKRPAEIERAFRSLILEHPRPLEEAEFGFSLVPLDFDGDGTLDFAIGAPGEGVVYILFGAEPTPYQRHYSIDANGRFNGPHEPRTDRFGTAVDAADLDGDGDDELVVGAPRALGPQGVLVGAIYVLGIAGATEPLMIQPRTAIEESFGQAVAFADFDQDGRYDLAVGAFRAQQGDVPCGRVTLFHDVLDDDSEALDLPNPNPTAAGCFGSHLAIDDMNGDGAPDLFVSGIGNDATDGTPHGGQVYCYPGDPRPDNWIVVEDQVATPADPPRFGMHIAARGGFLSVGAPRKDTRAILDSGLGQSYGGQGLRQSRAHGHPNPKQTDLFGYRTLIGDFIGDDTLDFAYSCLPFQGGSDPNPLAVFLFDGARKERGPVELLALPDSGDHFTMGVAVIDFDGRGKEDLVLGDSRYDRRADELLRNVGRVVIYY